MLLNQLREITGIQDSALLYEALKASNNDLTQAVGILTESVNEPATREVAFELSDTGGNATDKQVSVKSVPMHNKEVLQTTVAPSLQKDTGHQLNAVQCGRSSESQDSESKGRTKRKRCEVWGDNPNRNDLRRIEDWPVGLKNIGNTCWFSAVIQSLFHLPEFRRLVHSYSITQSMLEKCQSRDEKRNLAFMQELQCLFTLMVGSNRKFVDPSPALELLKDAFLSEEAQQQDVSEFTHKLLDWLEDAFQLTVNGEDPRDKSENPMVQLFYGTFLNEGFLEANKAFSNIETFGQYPLQVNGFSNLNECLEAAMVEGEIENMQTAQSARYRQERWFTKLPPVLTFELSRFEFNQSLGQPEKIHNKLEFPEIIYMDRFMYKNKELMRRKHSETRRLKGCIDHLNQKLESYLKYGSGPNRCPLPDMLQYVLEFANTKSAEWCPPTEVVTTSQSATGSTGSLDAQPLQNGFVGNNDTETSNDDSPKCESTSSLPPFVGHTVPNDCIPAEDPTHGSDTLEEIRSVAACLQRWRTEVEKDIQDLKDSIASCTKSIEEVFIDQDLSQVPYRLHAVLVHEGQANAGHYWAYIYSHSRCCWLKYNDVSVTEANWEELVRDSYGGMRNASAYCLMYINNKLPYLIADHEGELDDKINALHPALQCYVQEDNQRFDQEMTEWEEAHSCKIPQIESVGSSESVDHPSRNNASLCCEECSRSLSSEHAMIAKEQTALAITKTAESYERNGVEVALKEPTKPETGEASLSDASLTAQEETEPQPSSQLSEVEIPSVGKILVRTDTDGYNEEAFHEEYSRLYQLSKEEPSPSSDPRLQHVLIYFFQNKAPDRVIERTLLEQFADKNLSYNERSISIMKVAQAKLREIGPDDMDMKEYQKWHEDYSLFRKVSVYLLTGLELYQNEKWQEALTYLVYAYQCNRSLVSSGESLGVEETLIQLYRRKCLLKLNDKAATLFESSQEEQVSEGISIMNDLIIPCMHLIFNNKISEEDLSAIEEMRNRWCSYLGQDIDDNLQMKLGQFLPRLLDCSSDLIVLKEPPKIRPHSPFDLCNRFTAIMESIQGASTVTVT
eukprot:XP_017951462.1 PREDICTED: ubiquitin carboxyl-terminal hydrolase 28 isoform X2 [Xenopus tropicalis]